MAQRGVNRAIIIGNLGQDPDVRYMSNGNAVASISVATSEVWKDKNTGEQKEKTEWHRITFFNKLAEVVGQYLKKGAKIYVEGRLQTEKYQDKQGQDRYTTKIIASQMQMLDTRNNGQQETTQGQSAPPADRQGGGVRPSQTDDDDTIPF